MKPLSLQHRARIRRLGALPISRNLDYLASWYGTDKRSLDHAYTKYYARHLASRRRAELTVLEIGVGGQETNSGGASLRMWRSYLPNSKVVGVDLYEKHLPAERRITILQGDQSDLTFLHGLRRDQGPFDLIIDDGSHRGDHITITFEALWPDLNPGGFYVIEDLETAYDTSYGGGPRGAPNTAMTLLKGLLDDAQGGSRAVAAVHVYHNIAFVEKG